MRMIIDANYFANPALEAYLEAHRRNVVVFTDFACMESYGGRAGDRADAALVSIHESLRIVSRFPSQVLVLRSMGEIVKLQGEFPHATPEDFVDPDQTKGFEQFCSEISRARAAPATAQPVFEHGDAAAQYIDGAMLEGARSFPEWFEAVKEELGPDYLRRLRRGEPPTGEDLKKIAGCVLRRAAAGFIAHPGHPRPPKRSQLFRKTMIFRFALAHFALAEWFLLHGGPLPAHPKLRNDLVDMTYVAAATYFDGILTAETKVADVYGLAMQLLTRVLA